MGTVIPVLCVMALDPVCDTTTVDVHETTGVQVVSACMGAFCTQYYVACNFLLTTGTKSSLSLWYVLCPCIFWGTFPLDRP